ncbi:MAG: hypothetical protein PHF79_00605 [Candidatus Pacebacteria bacterium]|nr:hypothetical protein [Candidatus Paceibacterota bacterium]
MSKGDMIKTINSELQNLNREIDLKILKGLPYKREAKRHKFLLSQLHSLTRSFSRAASGASSGGWFRKAASAVASFVL